MKIVFFWKVSNKPVSGLVNDTDTTARSWNNVNINKELWFYPIWILNPFWAFSLSVCVCRELCSPLCLPMGTVPFMVCMNKEYIIIDSTVPPHSSCIGLLDIESRSVYAVLTNLTRIKLSS